MFDGIEVDVLSLGDADCIVVTQWASFGPQRILIDGGAGDDSSLIEDFLLRRAFTNFWAVLCSHAHNDHGGGLSKIIRNRAFTFHNGWIHDIRKHIGADVLRRATAGNSDRADGVRQAVETTREIVSALTQRNLVVQEPFAGAAIAGYPSMQVLGPSQILYDRVVADFIEQEFARASRPPSFIQALAAAGVGSRGSQPFGIGNWPAAPVGSYTALSNLLARPASTAYVPVLPSLVGVLSESSVKKEPETQIFNNTSTVIGIEFAGQKLLFTGDAGADALSRIPSNWTNVKWMQVPHHGSDGNLSQQLIERFCPEFANISARGDSSHPSRAIVSGLVKVGSKVFSTHQSGHLWFHMGRIPERPDYSEAVPMRGTGGPIPIW